MPHAFLTKSAFIQGYDCPQRLQYFVSDRFAKKDEGDDFLRMLADGGLQFETLVRHAWPGETLGGFPIAAEAAHTKTIAALVACLKSGKGVLHEAVFVSGNLFARVDMLRVNGKSLELCEIKAKSYAGPEDKEAAVDVIQCDGDSENPSLILTKGTGKKPARVKSVWVEYIADISFQTIVVKRAIAAEKLKGLTVSPRLLLANKNQVAGNDGWDWFGNVAATIDSEVRNSERKRPRLHFVREPHAGFRSPLIAEIDVKTAVDLLCNESAQSGAACWKDMTLEAQIDDASKLVLANVGVVPSNERGWKCRGCQFNCEPADGKQSGFDLCWGKDTESARNLFELYHGRTYAPPGRAANEDDEWVKHVMSTDGNGKELRIADLFAETDDTGKASGAPSVVRRTRQIEATKNGAPMFSEEFASEVKRRLMPQRGTGILRFMDFETTSACLPYAIGMKPYEVVAFQFSVHSLVVRDGKFDVSKIHHVEELCIGESTAKDIHEQDVAFATSLKKALTESWEDVEDETGSVFHWASHERTVMRLVSKRLQRKGGQDELVKWLDATCEKEDAHAPGRLIDLLKIAEAHTFHPLQHGRFSIKKFLPALCSEDGVLKVIEDLMSDMKKPEPAEDGCRDPYKSLPPLADCLGDCDTGLVKDDDDDDDSGDGIRNGTSAMRAYQQLRFSECVQWKDANKKPIDRAAVEKALLEYCKLDSAAMVAVWWWLWTQAARRAVAGSTGCDVAADDRVKGIGTQTEIHTSSDNHRHPRMDPK